MSTNCGIIIYKHDEMTRLAITNTEDSISRKLAIRKVTLILVYILYSKKRIQKWFRKRLCTRKGYMNHQKSS